MSITDHAIEDDGLPPPGSRWGAGARSVLPYLTQTLQARPASAADGSREGKQPRECEGLQREAEGHPALGEAAPRGTGA